MPFSRNLVHSCVSDIYVSEHDYLEKRFYNVCMYVLLIVSEIGDINRFPDSYHLCSYAGLVPSTHSSGGITYHGSITKRGSKYL